MTPEPTTRSTATQSGHRPAVWPWLLLPLAALTLFFALRTAKEWPAPAPDVEATAPDTAHSEPFESR
jgi:hypothetical protein